MAGRILRLTLLAGILAAAAPRAGLASQAAPPPPAPRSPFSGVTHFLAPEAKAAPPHRKQAKIASRATPAHVAAAPARALQPAPPPRAYAYQPYEPPPSQYRPYAYYAPVPYRPIYPRYVYWAPAYPTYVYPRYGYVYYTPYPYAYPRY